MEYFLGNKIPTRNPFWEEATYADMPDYWKWFQLGWEEGYEDGSGHYNNLQDLAKENEALKNLLDTRARWDKENLPDEEQEFISQFIEKHSQINT